MEALVNALMAIGMLLILILVIYLIDRVNAIEKETRKVVTSMHEKSARAATPFMGLSSKKLWDAMTGRAAEGLDAEAIIELRNQLDDQIASFANMDESIAKAKDHLAKAQDQAEKAAAQLSKSRNQVLDSIVLQLTNSLAALGIPNATLAWENTQREMRSNGIDKIQLLFSANKGLSPKPFKQVASGGELSRLMLSIKHLLAQKRALPTLILDEIDTGVSGEIAIKIGQMLTQMSQGHQLIAITHLPQIAAAGTTHWYVYKDHAGEKTVSSLRELKGEERVDEIAKMIGGQHGYVELKDNVRKLIQANHVE